MYILTAAGRLGKHFSSERECVRRGLAHLSSLLAAFTASVLAIALPVCFHLSLFFLGDSDSNLF